MPGYGISGQAPMSLSRNVLKEVSNADTFQFNYLVVFLHDKYYQKVESIGLLKLNHKT